MWTQLRFCEYWATSLCACHYNCADLEWRTEAHLGPIKKIFFEILYYEFLNLLQRILESVITNFRIRYNKFEKIVITNFRIWNNEFNFKELGPRTAKWSLMLIKIMKYGIVQCLLHNKYRKVQTVNKYQTFIVKN